LNYKGDRPQCRDAGGHVRGASVAYPALRGANQLLTASAALAALEALATKLPVSQQAVRQGLLTVQLPARFQVLPGRPAIVLDVAHNPHAAAVLAENLDIMGFYPQTHGVFGMLNDKDIGGVAARVGDRVDHWYVGPTAGARGASAASMARQIKAVIPAASVSEHASVADALASAREHANADDRILAFGSFVSVAEVMRTMAGTSATVENIASHRAPLQ